MILPGILPCEPLRNTWEHISYFIQPLFSLIILCHGCYGAHTITNAFEKISVTQLSSERHTIDVILVVHLTTDHL